MAVKEIRILDADGTVVDADADTHVTTRPNKGGADKVKWVVFKVGGGVGQDFEVVFGSPDPTSPGKVIQVSGGPAGSGPPIDVPGLPGTYKYTVRRKIDGVVTDDPNIIIKS